MGLVSILQIQNSAWVETGLFPTDTPPNSKQHSAEFNKLRVTTWVSEMEDLRDVILWVTNHSLKMSNTL